MSQTSDRTPSLRDYNRFILCGFWSIFYVYVAELYPTQTRSLGYGWTSVMGMIGSTLSPFITTISSSIGINSWFPPALLGLVPLFVLDELLDLLHLLRVVRTEALCSRLRSDNDQSDRKDDAIHGGLLEKV